MWTVSIPSQLTIGISQSSSFSKCRRRKPLFSKTATAVLPQEQNLLETFSKAQTVALFLLFPLQRGRTRLRVPFPLYPEPLLPEKTIFSPDPEKSLRTGPYGFGLYLRPFNESFVSFNFSLSSGSFGLSI